MDKQNVPGMLNMTLNGTYPMFNYENVSVFEVMGHDTNQCLTFNFGFYGMLIGTLCLLGIAGNTLSILVLQKDKGNQVAFFLLQALAVADNAVLILSLIVFTIIYGILPFLHESNDPTVHLYPYINKYVMPLAYMAQTQTVWVTVLLAFNRFIAICNPFRTQRWSNIGNVRIQVICVTAFALLYNMPRFWQFQIEYVQKENATDAVIRSTDTVIGETTLFGFIYTNVLFTILVLFLPLVLLIFLNGKLARELQRMKKRLSSIGVQDQASEPDNITLVMVMIIIVFIVCNTPDRIYQIVRHFVQESSLGCGRAMYYYYAVCNLLIIVNSSGNFLVYYFLRKRFRRILCQKLCCFNLFKKFYNDTPEREDNCPKTLPFLERNEGKRSDIVEDKNSNGHAL